MTKNAAIQAFFSSFGLSAYPESSVPTSGDDMPEYPYLTYEASTDSDFNEISVTASLWYRTEKWTDINAKTEEIAQAVGGAKILHCDNGGIIVRKGTPFAQPMDDPNDDMVKRKLLTFDFKYTTTF